MSMNEKTGTSFRLSKDALLIISKLSVELGISKTAVIELSVRSLQEKERD